MKFLKFFESFINPEKNMDSDLESELNVVDTISRNDIGRNVPKEATYAMLSPSVKFIQKFYKFKEVNFSDNTTEKILNYWGEQGGWHPSSYNKNGNDYHKLKDSKFIKIID